MGVPDVSGAPKMAYQYTRSLLAAGYRVIAVCGRLNASAAGMTDKFRAAGAAIYEEPGFRRLYDFGLVRRVTEILAAEDAQCVISTQKLDLKIAALAAHRVRIPCVRFTQGLAAFHGAMPLALLKRHAYAYIINRYVSHLICVSEKVRQQHVTVFGVSPEKTTVVENGIDLAGFEQPGRVRSTEVRAAFGAGPADLLTLCVGRLEPDKGQHLLLTALASMASHRRPRLVLVGDVPPGGESRRRGYRGKLERLVEQHRLGDHVVFAGWRNDVPQLLASADCYVHPSLREGLPLAVLEGMAAGLPTIFTDCFQPPTGFVPATHGLIAKAGQSDALVQALNTISNMSAAERTSMGQAARELIYERFDVRQSGRHFVAVIERILNGVKPAGIEHEDLADPQPLHRARRQ